MTITYNKDGAYIEVTEDGVVHRRSIKWKDCVISVPGGANLKVDLAYVNELDQLVLVLEDESEIIICSETETDAKIAVHAGLPNVHHYAPVDDPENKEVVFELGGGGGGGGGGYSPSEPPEGFEKILNAYFSPDDQEMVIIT